MNYLKGPKAFQSSLILLSYYSRTMDSPTSFGTKRKASTELPLSSDRKRRADGRHTVTSPNGYRMQTPSSAFGRYVPPSPSQQDLDIDVLTTFFGSDSTEPIKFGTGNTEAPTGTTEAATGTTEAATGTTEAATGNTKAPIVYPEPMPFPYPHTDDEEPPIATTTVPTEKTASTDSDSEDDTPILSPTRHMPCKAPRVSVGKLPPPVSVAHSDSETEEDSDSDSDRTDTDDDEQVSLPTVNRAPCSGKQARLTGIVRKSHSHSHRGRHGAMKGTAVRRPVPTSVNKPKCKKRRSWKSIARREIRDQQKNSYELAIPKLSFQRLVREIMCNPDIVGSNTHLRMQGSAVLALQEAAEAYLVKYFEDTDQLADHANRLTVMKKDSDRAGRLLGYKSK